MSIINEAKQCCHNVDIKFLNGSYISFCKKCGKILDTYTEITNVGPLPTTTITPGYVQNYLGKVTTEPLTFTKPPLTITERPIQVITDSITGTFYKPEYVVTSTIGGGEKLTTTTTISNLYTTS